MPAKFTNGNVRSFCPKCGTPATFYFKDNTGEFGYVAEPGVPRTLYTLMSCGGCGRGALATLRDSTGQNLDIELVDFYPVSIEQLALPSSVPSGIVSEFREAETSASVKAWRGASALLRSCLEKTLIANGYAKGRLVDRIDEAAVDGVITAARQKRAHDEVRVLGNDVLHDEWREVKEEEYTAAHFYVQRILEDIYDQRDEVEQVLKTVGRLKADTK